MTAKKTPKRLTAAEKKWNREWKQKMIDEGVIPPPKKPLNRKKFCQEVHAALVEENGNLLFRLRDALGWMIPSAETRFPISQEQLGVLKLVKIAVDLERFWQQKQSEGVTSTTIDEVYQTVVKPILDL